MNIRLLAAALLLAVPISAQAQVADPATRVQGTPNDINRGYPVKTGCTYNSSAPTATDGKVIECQANVAGAEKVETVGNVASLATDSGNPVKVGCVYVSAGVAPTTGQRVDLQCTNIGSVKNTPFATVGGGATETRVITGTTGFIKAAAGTLYQVVAINTNAAARYVHIYNKASAPTLSTDTPILTIYLPATSQTMLPLWDIGMSFTTGLAWSYTTDNASAPATAATSGELSLSVSYK